MEKKERTITKVEKKGEASNETKNIKQAQSLTAAEEKSKATTNRIVAFILWAVALTCEIIAILLINEKIKLPFFSTHDDVRIALWIPLVIFILIDLVCCIIAALLWKKASRLDPFKKTNNKVGFFIRKAAFPPGKYVLRPGQSPGLWDQDIPPRGIRCS